MKELIHETKYGVDYWYDEDEDKDEDIVIVKGRAYQRVEGGAYQRVCR